ncbi:carbohydrate ABC transporter permease [Rhizobium leguminosarum]|uniref:carbohydrate ABC transporter permease n=1 Tax=Rhizobium leguminosarum TaxID=384 RepID=UPI001F281CBB|nr:sugar ABC transporter permease [Rhizobium leguminosarum]UIJ83210.1 sugar ABC transporter permease [Rhizobium leguminosarum]
MSRRSAVPYVLLVPGMLLLSVFLIVPSIYGFWLSLHEFDGINLGAWSGLGQYQAVLADPEFRRSLWHTVEFAIVVVIGKNAVGLALAVLVSAPLKGARLARTLLFLPVTMNVIVVGAFWTFFLSARRFGGLFNEMLNSVGLGMLETSWLSSEQTALVSVAAVEIWRWAGLHMLLFLAGMQVIEPQLYDAGRMDGANAWVRFWHITVPQLGPVLSVSILLALMGAFVRSFDVVWVLTRGGFGTDVVVTHMYNEAFQFSRFGRAAAMGYVLFAIIAIITFTFVLISRRKLRDV